MDTLPNIDAQLLLAFPRPWSSAHLTTVETGTGFFALPAEDMARCLPICWTTTSVWGG